MNHLPMIYQKAVIAGEDGPVHLALFLDTDERYRWYLIDGTEADTEVSGETVESAIDAAFDSWRNWDIEFI